MTSATGDRGGGQGGRRGKKRGRGRGSSRGGARPPLGQHFLSDRRLLARIVDALDAARGAPVLEIGAGTGTLTEALVERGLRVIAVERDPLLAETTRTRLVTKDGSGGSAEIVQGDALALDWHALLGRERAGEASLIGNIPYQITSPLIEKALTAPLPRRIVFLVQAEVADRLAAAPGSRTYGALSVGVQAVCRVERLFTVRPGVFRPPPKVASALVRLTPLAEPLISPGEGAAFRRFVTACFGRRRKQLANVVAGVTGRLRTEVEAALVGLGLDPRARPETLGPEAFVRLLRWSTSL